MRPLPPKIVGVVNITEDSFSDGARYIDPARAIACAQRLLSDGADLVELGPAASNPGAAAVTADEEIRRIAPVLDVLTERGATVALDSWQPQTQRYAIARGVAALNDIEGFAHPEIYPELARADCRLVMVHTIQGRGKADRRPGDPDKVLDLVSRFFDERLQVLEAAGVMRERVVLDPGMGLFLGSNPEPSLVVLGAITGRAVGERGPATLAAELYAASKGADYIRTHDVAALRAGLDVHVAIEAAADVPAGVVDLE